MRRARVEEHAAAPASKRRREAGDEDGADGPTALMSVPSPDAVEHAQGEERAALLQVVEAHISWVTAVATARATACAENGEAASPYATAAGPRAPLGAACEKRDRELIRWLLKTSPISSRRYVHLVKCAFDQGHADVLDTLLDSLKPAKHDNLAIRLAAKFGLVKHVKELLRHPEVSPGAVEDASLILACEYGFAEIVRLLLADPRVNAAARNDCPLRWGAQHGNAEIVTILLTDPRVNPQACENFAVRQAAIRGHAEVVQLLLDAGAEPSAKENRAVRLASANGHHEVVGMLLRDARVDPSDRGNIAITRAAKGGHVAVVRKLLADGRADPAVEDNMPLIKAAKHGHVLVVDALLRDARVTPAAQNARALREALAFLREGNKEAGAGVARLLLASREVQRCVASWPECSDSDDALDILADMQAAALRAAQRGAAWHASCRAAQPEGLARHSDLVGKVLAMAFGAQAIPTRDCGPRPLQDRAEALMSAVAAAART